MNLWLVEGLIRIIWYIYDYCSKEPKTATDRLLHIFSCTTHTRQLFDYEVYSLFVQDREAALKQEISSLKNELNKVCCH